MVLKTFQLKCCGVDNYEDFQTATEFLKYTQEENNRQKIPESCCILDDAKELQYFTPKDPNCISDPTTTNSYMNQVYTHIFRENLSGENLVLHILYTFPDVFLALFFPEISLNGGYH